MTLAGERATNYDILSERKRLLIFLYILVQFSLQYLIALIAHSKSIASIVNFEKKCFVSDTFFKFFSLKLFRSRKMMKNT